MQPAALSQVRRQFQDLTFFQDTGDKGKGKGAMVGSYVTNLLRLCGKLNLAELMQIRANTFKWRENRAFEDYQDFVAQHFLPRGIKGLPWRWTKYSDSVYQLTEHNIRSSILHLYKQHSDDWNWRLSNRSAGSGVSSDGARRVPGRVAGDGSVLYMLMSDDGCILGYYTLITESWDELGPALDKLADRLQRLGTLNKLKFWYTDTCCHRASAQNMDKHKLLYRFDNRPEVHDQLPPGFRRRFPSILRCPYLDLWHAINRITEAANSACVAELEQLSVDISQALYYLLAEDVACVVEYLRSDRRKRCNETGATAHKLTQQEAQIKAVADYRGFIRTAAYSIAQQDANLQRVIDKWTEIKRNATAKGEQCVIRNRTPVRRGTIDQITLLRACVQKGCLQLPLSWEQMWVPIRTLPVTGLVEYIAKHSTSKNECTNRVFNTIVEGVSHLGDDIAQAYLAAKVELYNDDRDKVLGRVDLHSYWLDPWRNTERNQRAQQLLDGPLPFPYAETPVEHPLLTPLGNTPKLPKGHPDYEYFGYEYLDQTLRRRAEASSNGGPAHAESHVATEPNELAAGAAVADDSVATACSEDEGSPPYVAGQATARVHINAGNSNGATGKRSRGLSTSGNMKVPSVRAYKLDRICKPTSEAEILLAGEAAAAALAAKPDCNKGTWTLAAQNYNALALSRAASDISFEAHRTTAKYMQSFCLASHRNRVSGTRLRGLDTQIECSAAGIHFESSSVEVGTSSACAATEAPATHDALSHLAEAALESAHCNDLVAIDSRAAISKHQRYHRKQQETEVVVERRKVLTLTMPKMRQLAKLIGVPYSKKDKDDLAAAIEGKWADNAVKYGECITLPPLPPKT